MQFLTIASTVFLAQLATAADHVVAVGKDGLTFSPDTITAAQDDTVTFHYWPSNHSVVQSSFAKPCEPLSGQNTIYSGFFPTSSGMSNETYSITIKNASAPIWLYCSQGKHCQNGMVAVINAPASGPNTLDAFKTTAKSATNNTTPTTLKAGNGGTIGTMSMDSGSSSGSTNTTTTPGAAAALNTRTAAQFSGLIAIAAGVAFLL